MKSNFRSVLKVLKRLNLRPQSNEVCRNISTSSFLSAKWEDTFLTKDKPTFFYDESMPSLPVPKLDHTLNLYLSSAKPFLTGEQFSETEKVVAEFQNGKGQKLQMELEEMGRTQKNWLTDWWEKYGYLQVRAPTIPLQNIVVVNEGVGSRVVAGIGQQRYQNGARQLYWATKFWLVLRDEKLRPEHLADGTQINMNQFRRMFSMNRLPGETVDRLHTYWKPASEGAAPTHIVVMCRGHLYKLDVLTSSGQLLSVADWVNQLDQVWNESQATRGPGVGALTVDDRTCWYKNRNHLQQLDMKNAESLEVVEKAMFAVALDETEPLRDTIHWEISCGDVQNRWADKSMNLVLFRNGMVAWNMDHTPVDGMAPITMLTFTQVAMDNPGPEYTEKASKGVTVPQKLSFAVDDKIKEQVQHVIEKSNVKNQQARYKVDYVHDIGKAKLRTARVHPDAFVQLNMQLAYMRLHGRPAPCYETATTRQFYNARTETVRTCTNEAVAWARAMMDPNSDKSTLHDLLMKAASKFLSVMNLCKNGNGCDRHLLGLKILAAESGLSTPDIFTDPAWTKSGGSGNFLLSSSLLGYNPISAGTVPMLQDGYGCFYNIQSNRIEFFVSQWKSSSETDAANYFKLIKDNFRESAALLV